MVLTKFSQFLRNFLLSLKKFRISTFIDPGYGAGISSYIKPGYGANISGYIKPWATT